MATEAQSTNHILMIRPVRFEANAETAESNAFQQLDTLDAGQAQVQALAEFDALVEMLRSAGVNVLVVEDTPEPHTPDAIFPNNWVSFHADGSVVLYPMEALNRRGERRLDIVQGLEERVGFRLLNLVDYTHHERHGRYLEGTGSLVLDRANRVAYACLSSRTNREVLDEWAEDLGYRVVAFSAEDHNGKAIYHTNVMMCVGSDYAVVCSEAIADSEERDAVRRSLEASGHRLIEITLEQMNAFAGNMLEVRGAGGELLLTMSRRAHESLHDEQRESLERSVRIVSSPINAIEDCAGGSVRCMMAEIFVPEPA